MKQNQGATGTREHDFTERKDIWKYIWTEQEVGLVGERQLRAGKRFLDLFNVIQQNQE